MAASTSVTVRLGGPYETIVPRVSAWHTEGYFPHVSVECDGFSITATTAGRDDYPDGAAELRKFAAALIEAADQLDDLADVAVAEQVPA